MANMYFARTTKYGEIVYTIAHHVKMVDVLSNN